ncbi:MAG TPA: lamin tail domain-containing protein, partial [Patescibacteria group bacterium]|nr:lamin tail domain-containing protein [Patescibacteria group bacterium]
MLAGWLPVSAATPSPALAAASDLFFSEYIEGSSNNKALEIYNGTGSAIDLATGGYNVQMFFNGSATAGLTINLTGTVAAGDVYVLAQSSAAAAILAQADQTNGSGWFNGDDAVVLRKGTVIVDSVGQSGFDPGTEWGSGLVSTADNTLRRKASVCAGDPNTADAFDPSVEWDGFATDTFDGLGAHTATCGDVSLSISVADVSADEGDSGTTSFDFIVSLSGPAPSGGVTFDIATADGTATIADNDYV